MQYECHHTGIVGSLPDTRSSIATGILVENAKYISDGQTVPSANCIDRKMTCQNPLSATQTVRPSRRRDEGLPYEGFRFVVALGGGVEWSGWDATVRFCVSVETDFSRSQAKAGAAAMVRSKAAANKRAILRSPEGRFVRDWTGHP
jgi:hypothetical protein